jgi:hypothetical protein
MEEQNIPVTELSRDKGSERFVGRNGEINASDKIDLLSQV